MLSASTIIGAMSIVAVISAIITLSANGKLICFASLFCQLLVIMLLAFVNLVHAVFLLINCNYTLRIKKVGSMPTIFARELKIHGIHSGNLIIVLLSPSVMIRVAGLFTKSVLTFCVMDIQLTHFFGLTILRLTLYYVIE